ncbi:transposase [Trichonephila clavipes]|nr:transposase [Trichonephila clavipes]
MERYRNTFTLIDNSHPQRRRTVRTEEAIATVERSIEEDPNESIRHQAQELDLCPSTLWKICGRILVESFFKNDEDHNVTVNGDRYRDMITNFFIPELNNNDVQEMWFQQDGATCHTARATIDLLKDTFGDRLISRFGPVNWPPRSCDLTPLDYFCGVM